MEAVDFTQCATHGSFGRRWQETLYNMFTFATLFVLPLLAMSCCYSRILLHMHAQHLRGRGSHAGFHGDVITSLTVVSQQVNPTCGAAAPTSSRRPA